MTSSERTARAAAARLPATGLQVARPQKMKLDTRRHEEARAAQARLRWGARWVASFRGGGEMGHDLDSSVRPEDVARSELFYASTCCWV